eukprot:TRINITY_DN4258_c0_g1_i1.p1 TRINITY_DN4258_c0_g1~~TRINITY_DN4258_c0_g1_i1.p1  ORF type:complete len:298 (+),score=101.57 TRINITY_DN4258_c0_g1_i1:100-894(+)
MYRYDPTEMLGQQFAGLAVLGSVPELKGLSTVQLLAAEECEWEALPYIKLLADLSLQPFLTLLVEKARIVAIEEAHEGLGLTPPGRAQIALAPAPPAAAPAAAVPAARDYTGLAALQASVGVQSTAVMQGPPAHALRQREEELLRREQEVAAKEASLSGSPPRGALLAPGSPGRPPPSPHKAQADAAGVLIDDMDLRDLFATYDRNGVGYVSKAEFKAEYRNFEDFGLPLTDKQLDRIFSQYSGPDERLTYEEFCILMLQRAKI